MSCRNWRRRSGAGPRIVEASGGAKGYRPAGLPNQYVGHAHLLEKRGIKFEEFAVPSGNLTMQQMVARQVDLGTYAGQSFIIGHDKDGLVAIAMIERVDKTARIMPRKERDSMPVFMAATPDFVEKNERTIMAYLQAWREVAADFKDMPEKVSDDIYGSSRPKATACQRMCSARRSAPSR
jgi:ABC-type nitrate/sulfonate/bicarbonate transport system substrate-binding protein